MKKLLFIISMILMLTMVSCGSSADAPASFTPSYDGYTVKMEDYTANLSVILPRDWEYRSVTSDDLPSYQSRLGVVFYPAEAPDIRVSLYCNDGYLGLCGTGVTFEDLNFGEAAGRVVKATETIGDMRSVYVTWEDKPPQYYAEYRIPEASADTWEPKILEILSSAQIAVGSISRQEAEAAAIKAFDGEYDQIGVTDYDHVSGNWYIRFQYTCSGDPASVRYVIHPDGKAEPVQLGSGSNETYGKPVVYLYPQTPTDITVRLPNTDLTVTYPAYNDGWSVTASPDGTLINHADGMEYSYLFWEGIGPLDADFSEGFCVRGEDTAAFLQKTLSDLGLTPREYNEFIVWWLPQMQNNAYNVINFVWKEYDTAAPLDITPAPDTLLRVFMVWQASEEFVDIPAPMLPAAPERIGFTVVEWGGTEIT